MQPDSLATGDGRETHGKRRKAQQINVHSLFELTDESTSRTLEWRERQSKRKLTENVVG